MSLFFIDSSIYQCTFVETTESNVPSFHFLPGSDYCTLHLTVLYTIRHSLSYPYSQHEVGVQL